MSLTQQISQRLEQEADALNHNKESAQYFASRIMQEFGIAKREFEDFIEVADFIHYAETHNDWVRHSLIGNGTVKFFIIDGTNFLLYATDGYNKPHIYTNLERFYSRDQFNTDYSI